jgi:hypothetical protein
MAIVGIFNRIRYIVTLTFLLSILQHVLRVTSTTATEGIFEEIPSTNISIPLFLIDKSYMAYIYVGTSFPSLEHDKPYSAQKKIVIVDTGSKNLVLPCKPCKQCGGNHFSPYPYDLEESSTDTTPKCHEGCVFKTSKPCTIHPMNKLWKSDKCEFHQKYSEGSVITGFEVNDWVWFGPDDERNSVDFYMQYGIFHTFGCQTKENGMIRDQYADGVFGLGLLQYDDDDRDRRNQYVHFVNTMLKNRLVHHFAFSMCLSKDAGILSLGGTSLHPYTDDLQNNTIMQRQPRHLQRMIFEPLRKSTYYKVKVRSFFVGKERVNININIDHYDDDDDDDDDTDSRETINAFNDERGTIIDSGTTESYFPEALAEPFREAWKKARGGAGPATEYDDESHLFSFEEFSSLPVITIVLSHGYKWNIEPRYYASTDELDIDFERGWEGKVEFEFQLNFDESKGCVLGANVMMGHDILFDLSQQRVGIAKSIC